jgi:hypothetical protein
MFFLVANKKKILTHKSTSSDIMINIASNISTDIMSEVITEGLQEIASECITTSNVALDGICLEPIVNFDEIYSINDFFYVKSDIVANIKQQRNNKNI